MIRNLIASTIALAIAGGSFAGASHAQSAGCFASEETPEWDSGNVGVLGAGSSRPAPSGSGFELCSDAAGFAEDADAYRYLVQRTAGEFAFETTLTSIDSIGTAGIAARRDARRADSAYVRITVSREPVGGFVVRSELRAEDGARSTPGGTVPLAAALPLRLRIERVGASFVTSIAVGDGPFVPHLTADVTGTGLEGGLVAVGLAQSSDLPGATATATFAAAGFDVDAGFPPDVAGCMDGFVAPTGGGSPVTLGGHFLDNVREVTIGGRDVAISSATATRLVLEAPASPSGIANDRLSIRSAKSSETLSKRLVWAGEPFVRGDLDGDGRVGRSDARLLDRHLAGRVPSLSCPEAADVDGDHTIDADDAARLRSFLAGTAAPPPAPFPSAGFAPDGGRSCGLPEAPRIRRLLDGQGRRRAARTALREGDVLTIDGRGFPSDPARALVTFGNVRTRTLEGSTDRSLRVEIGPVPDSGVKCPSILVDTGVSPLTLDPRDEQEQLTRFGLPYAVPPGRGRDDLCADFTASELDGVSVASLLPGTSSLFLPIARDFDRAQPIEIQVNLFLPLVNGRSRGGRIVRLQHFHPPFDDDTGAAGSSYESWLTGLARRLTVELNGGAADACDCDAKVEADAGAGGLVISPCEPVLGWIEPDPGPEPPAPPKTFPLKNPPPPLWGAVGFAVPEPEPGPVPKCWTAFPIDPIDEDQSVPSLSRDHFWCQFATVTAPSEKVDGLPLFESFIPVGTVFAGEEAIESLPPPASLTASQKSVMLSRATAHQAINGFYTLPCGPPARFAYCPLGPQKDPIWWMPIFPQGGWVMKGFWLPESKLPEHANLEHYYSYQPPAGERQYLAGMHLGVATGFHGITKAGRNYFAFATFFVRKPPGDTKRRDGTPLYYNDACVVGGFEDRPSYVTGVFRHYAMCRTGDQLDGAPACGNPWGPADECTSDQFGTCHGCHDRKDISPINSLADFHVGWLPTLVRYPENVECRDLMRAAFEEHGVELFKHLTPPECLP